MNQSEERILKGSTIQTEKLLPPAVAAKLIEKADNLIAIIKADDMTASRITSALFLGAAIAMEGRQI